MSGNSETSRPAARAARPASSRNDPQGSVGESRETPVGPASGYSSEEYLRLLIESATDYAIFSTDPQRRVTTWNRGAERVFGYAEQEIVGQSADVVFTPEDRAQGAPEAEMLGALRDGRALDERWHMRKGGQRFFASGVMMPIRAEDGALVGLVKITRDLTERKLAEDRLRAAQDELEARVRERTAELRATNEALRAEIVQRREAEAARQDLLRRLATTEEDERLRISRELHDEIGQHVAGLILGLNSLEQEMKSSGAASLLGKLQQLAETIARELHAIAVQLRPAALDDLGLVRALSTFVDAWSVRSGIKVELHATDLEEPRLPAAIELAVYRIVQEALTNVMKHAAATRVSLILNRRAGEVVAVIEDNGRGFDADAGKAVKTQGLGLLGMRERAAQFNGRITIESQPGQGTTLFVRLPIREP